MNVGLYVDKEAALSVRPALIDASKKDYVISYRQLSYLTSIMAQRLLDLGVGHGDIVMVMLRNCPELQICYFACFKIGAIMQPLNYFITGEDVFYAANQCHPKVFITQRDLWNEKVAPFRQKMDWLKAVYILEGAAGEEKSFADLLSPTEIRKFPQVTDQDFGQLFFVFAKEKTKFHGRGVLLTHYVMEWHSHPYERLHLGKDDVVAGILHPYNALTRAVLKAGATYIIIPNFTGDEFLDYCLHYKITFLGATPEQFRQILMAALNRGVFPQTLRACFSVGNILDTELWMEFEKRFKTRIYGGMGCKETGIFSLEPYDTPARYGSIGKVLPYMNYRISATDPTASKRGELLIKSDSLITHYWINGGPVPNQTDEGWFSTGYEVVADDDDYLFLTGTIADKSISGAKRYYNIK